MSSNTESFAFQAEINQLLSLIINTFYSNKDIFLRELISNSSDACDKSRYTILKEIEKYDTRDHEIRISSTKENVLMIEDDGIGMNYNDMVDHLGTIANSGTKNFIQNLKEESDMSMIGQFGVGFYSAFLVANEVRVTSRSIEDPNTYVWVSDAGGKFTITTLDVNDPLCLEKYGTRIELHLKEDATHYTKENTIREIVKKHSEYVSYPIKLLTKKTEKVEVEEEESDGEEGDVVEVEGNVSESKEKKYEERHVEEWVTLNNTKPIWVRKPEDVSDEEYNSFYKSISNDWEAPMTKTHFITEGSVEVRSLLYVPKKAPYDMFKSSTKKNNIKLYVKRVFIMDNCEEIIPDWLSFVTGVVDSEDLPLNVSREMLQQNKVMNVIRKNIVKKCIEMLHNLSEHEDYTKFYENFSQNIKLGIHEDQKNRDKLVKLLRFETTKHTKPISLTEYVSTMNGDSIYYITGSSRKNVENSPFVKGASDQGYDVLFMTEAIDEYMVQQVKEFEGKKLVNITKDNSMFQINDETLQNGVGKMITEYLPNHIEKVVVSNRLGSSPCCLVSSEYGMSANMERIMKAQTLNNPSHTMYNNNKKTMEINPNHPIIKHLQSSIKNSDMNDSSRKDVVNLLYDTALLNSGYSQEDTSRFIDRVLKMMMVGMDIDRAPEDATAPEEDMEMVD